ncbi:MAG: hypothetical protein WBD55_08145 [Dehalococcoidia bacterium]
MNPTQPRPLIIAAIAFGAGAIIAVVIVLVIVFTVGGDDSNDGSKPQTNTTPTAPAAPTSAGPTPDRTPATGAASRPDAALDEFIAEQFQADHIGDCPQEIPQGGPPKGICSKELYRSADLVTFLIGPPFSEFLGETVITREGDSWSLTFVAFGELGATVAVGAGGVVYGAGNCLNFRTAPGTDADVASCQIDGTKSNVVEGPREADGRTWWRLDGLGWAAEEFLRPAAE